MKIKTIRKLTLIFLICGLCLSLFGQEEAPPGPVGTDQIGTDTSQQMLKEISLSKFEDAGLWTASVSSDFGLAHTRRLEGGPADKEPIPDEEAAGITSEDKYVLGVKMMYYTRSAGSLFVYARRPLPIEGISKAVSVWVVGRNYEHVLKLIYRDFTGRIGSLVIDKLNFTGWKKLEVAIPPTIPQRDLHYSSRSSGLEILGFEIQCDPKDTYGSYYVYFDDLRVVTDLFTEESRDPDDMQDAW